jgi:predicted nuclease of restriction endonuclease-like (RecB) superfamily
MVARSSDESTKEKEVSGKIQEGFKEILKIIENAKLNAYRAVNKELINMYWSVGEYLSIKCGQSNYGDSFIDETAEFMEKGHPEIRGFNRRGLYRMRQFYETYNGNEKILPLLTLLTWSNHLQILASVKNIEAKEFYIDMCVREKYSARELERQIHSAYYERYMLSAQKLPPAELPHNENVRFLDSYVMEFLDLPEKFSESDLKRAIIRNLKNFILEIGKDFTFVGEEYRIQVGTSDFFIDLLFYSRGLSCLVAFELKIDKFQPEYMGKMNFYLEALDRDVKRVNENPSIGIILCASKEEEVVEYAMSRNLSPPMVAEYKLKLIKKELLEQKLREFKGLLTKKTGDKGE